MYSIFKLFFLPFVISFMFIGNHCDSSSNKDLDNDGINDTNESFLKNQDNITCDILADCDYDGLTDSLEINFTNSDGQNCATLPDCDSDGVGDFHELAFINSNGIHCIILADCDNDGVDDFEDFSLVNRRGQNCIVLSDCDDDKINDKEDKEPTLSAMPDEDPDKDKIINKNDNCPDVYNPEQINSDEDAKGNACDDEDGDSDNDNLLDTHAIEQLHNKDGVLCASLEDCDNDGYKDYVDPDADGNRLIEVFNIETLHSIRDDLDGNGEDDGLIESVEAVGTDGCGAPNSFCQGYELIVDLDFQNRDSYKNSSNISLYTRSESLNKNPGWTPIGNLAFPFSSQFDGKGHSINNLYILSKSNQIALFGATKEAMIKNLLLLNVNVTGNRQVAAFVGNSSSSTTISHVQASGMIQGVFQVGGLIGFQTGSSSILSYSFSLADLKFCSISNLFSCSSSSPIQNNQSTIENSNGQNGQLGGLIGSLENGFLVNAYSIASLLGGLSSNAGGLVGLQSGGIIYNAYSVSFVNAYSKAGGLIGSFTGGSLDFAYASGTVTIQDRVKGILGGLIASKSEETSPIQAYWNKETFGINISNSINAPKALSSEKLQCVAGQENCDSYRNWAMQPQSEEICELLQGQWIFNSFCNQAQGWNFGTPTEFPALNFPDTRNPKQLCWHRPIKRGSGNNTKFNILNTCSPFVLTSSATDEGFDPGSLLPQKFTDSSKSQCTGSNIFPKLTWQNIPDNTQSFILVVEEEFQQNSNIQRRVHLNAWYNKEGKNVLPTEINQSQENSFSSKIAWSTAQEAYLHPRSWAGLCPSSATGLHTYYFKLYALDILITPEKLAVSPLNNERRAAVEEIFESNIIMNAEIYGTIQK